MAVGLNARLIAAAAAPPLAVGGAALLGVPAVGVMAVAVGAAAVAGGLVAWLWRPVARLERHAAAVADLAAVTVPPGVAGVGLVIDRLAERNGQFERALAETAAALAGLADDFKAPPAFAGPASPWPERSAAVADAYARCAAAATTAYRKALAYQALLNDIPDPVAVCDSKMRVMFLNAAAAQFFPDLPNAGVGAVLPTLLVAPQAAAGEAGRMPLAPKAVETWLVGGQGGTREAVAASPDGRGTPVELAAVPHFARRARQYLTVVLRDLTTARRDEAGSRRQQRQIVGQRLCRLVEREVGPAMEVVRAQAALLTQAAKQAGQRERFLPKVQRIVQEVDREDLLVAQLGWLGRLSTGQVGEPQAEEVRLGAVADEIAEKLATSLAERTNSLAVSDEAGWVLGDEAWLAAMMTGMLLYANQRVEGGAITLRLTRRSVVGARDELAEVAVRFPAPPPADDALADAREPYRRPNSAVFDPAGQFLLGLAVAHRIAAMMYGELHVEATGGGTELRAVVPTRIAHERTATIAAAQTASVADLVIDAVGEWEVGGAPAKSRGAVATAVPAFAGPDPADDTVGGWFD